MSRRHRLEAAYPALWAVVAGQIRAAAHAHPDIIIPERRLASIVKRVVGAVLAQAGPGRTGGRREGSANPSASGGDCEAVAMPCHLLAERQVGRPVPARRPHTNSAPGVSSPCWPEAAPGPAQKRGTSLLPTAGAERAPDFSGGR